MEDKVFVFENSVSPTEEMDIFWGLYENFLSLEKVNIVLSLEKHWFGKLNKIKTITPIIGVLKFIGVITL